MLFPEPAADIHAQWMALCNPAHPKAAMFVAPGNAAPAETRGFLVVSRAEGTLITRDWGSARAFALGQTSEADMARFLDYPEPKDDVAKNCGQNLNLAVVVQARDGQENVITEAAASPFGIKRTVDALSAHVPAGGRLVITSPIEAIIRRMVLRHIEGIG